MYAVTTRQKICNLIDMCVNRLRWCGYIALEESTMRCQLSTLMGSSRYSIQDVHNKTGLARSTVAQLYHDRASRIDFVTMEKLCALFDCELDSLLELEGIEVRSENHK